MIWISYTTRYRTGSDKFARAAETMRQELAAKHPGVEVRLEPLVRKGDFVAALARIAGEGKQLAQLHFLGHSGMYGIMFGSVAWPEQFSPHEWRTMRIPFAPGAHAYFHACRTGRWFAPFFARTFGVHAHGHHGYTTVSTSPERFAWEPLRLGGGGRSISSPVPATGLTGCRARSPSTSARRRCRWRRTRPRRPGATPPTTRWRRFTIGRSPTSAVRRDEWRWLNARLDRAAFPGGRPRVLDVGCGTGALLRALAGRVATALGSTPPQR